MFKMITNFLGLHSPDNHLLIHNTFKKPSTNHILPICHIYYRRSWSVPNRVSPLP